MTREQLLARLFGAQQPGSDMPELTMLIVVGTVASMAMVLLSLWLRSKKQKQTANQRNRKRTSARNTAESKPKLSSKLQLDQLLNRELDNSCDAQQLRQHLAQLCQALRVQHKVQYTAQAWLDWLAQQDQEFDASRAELLGQSLYSLSEIEHSSYLSALDELKRWQLRASVRNWQQQNPDDNQPDDASNDLPNDLPIER